MLETIFYYTGGIIISFIMLGLLFYSLYFTIAQYTNVSFAVKYVIKYYYRLTKEEQEVIKKLKKKFFEEEENIKKN